MFFALIKRITKKARTRRKNGFTTRISSKTYEIFEANRIRATKGLQIT